MKPIQIAFRVDASLAIGAGHVMRCLTLADTLRTQGAICRFISRAHAGHLNAYIGQRGFEVISLPAGITLVQDDRTETSYDQWLGVSWQEDAALTVAALGLSGVQDWLVVDHYALDWQWEGATRQCARQVLVIDDLVNRKHTADILLDQTYGRLPSAYSMLTNTGCEVRCGVEHVLIRPEFLTWRTRSIQRRGTASLRHIVISLGGIDKDNVSKDILVALHGAGLLGELQVSVILGTTSPWIDMLTQFAHTLSPNVTVLAGVSNMAEILTGCDLVIGAAGSSAWERCCLGVPSLLLTLAENQREIAKQLVQAKAVWAIDDGKALGDQVVNAVTALRQNPEELRAMAEQAFRIGPSGSGLLLAEHMMGKARHG